MLSVLNLFCCNELLGSLVLKTHDLPDLFKVTVIFIHLTILLVQRLVVVGPVVAILVDERHELLVGFRAAQLWHDGLECVLIPGQHDTPGRG